MSTATHLHKTAAGVAFVLCEHCVQPVTLTVTCGELRTVAHDQPGGEPCPASGAALGRVHGGCGKEQGQHERDELRMSNLGVR